MSFSVGDSVICRGLRGLVRSYDAGSATYPVKVSFSNGETKTFTSEGREYRIEPVTLRKALYKQIKLLRDKVVIFNDDGSIIILHYDDVMEIKTGSIILKNLSEYHLTEDEIKQIKERVIGNEQQDIID